MLAADKQQPGCAGPVDIEDRLFGDSVPGRIGGAGNGVAFRIVFRQQQMVDRDDAVDIHQQVDDVRHAQLALERGRREIVGLDETAVERRTVENLLDRFTGVAQFPQGKKTDGWIEILLDLEPDLRLDPFDVRIGSHFHIGANRNLLDADDLHRAVVFIQVAVSLQRRLRGLDGFARPLGLFPVALHEGASRIFKQGHQACGGRRHFRRSVAEDAQGRIFNRDRSAGRAALDVETEVEDVAPVIPNIIVAILLVQDIALVVRAKYVEGLRRAKTRQLRRERAVAVKKQLPLIAVQQRNIGKAHLHDDGVSTVAVAKNRLVLDFAIVQVTELRISFEFEHGFVQPVRPHFLGGRLDIRRLLIAEQQLILDDIAPGEIARIAGAFLAGHPGVANLLQVDQQAAKIVGRRGVDRQNVPGGEKRLIRIGL